MGGSTDVTLKDLYSISNHYDQTKITTLLIDPYTTDSTTTESLNVVHNDGSSTQEVARFGSDRTYYGTGSHFYTDVQGNISCNSVEFYDSGDKWKISSESSTLKFSYGNLNTYATIASNGASLSYSAQPSDDRIKEQEEILNGELAKNIFDQIDVKTYRREGDTDWRIGFIAQEVEGAFDHTSLSDREKQSSSVFVSTYDEPPGFCYDLVASTGQRVLKQKYQGETNWKYLSYERMVCLLWQTVKYHFSSSEQNTNTDDLLVDNNITTESLTVTGNTTTNGLTVSGNTTTTT